MTLLQLVGCSILGYVIYDCIKMGILYWSYKRRARKLDAELGKVAQQLQTEWEKLIKEGKETDFDLPGEKSNPESGKLH